MYKNIIKFLVVNQKINNIKERKKIYYLLEQIMISNYLLDVLMLFQKKKFFVPIYDG